MFAAVVLRMLPKRFVEIEVVEQKQGDAFEVYLKRRISADQFVVQFENYMRHLHSEFGDPDFVYTFAVIQGRSFKKQLIFAELNPLEN